MPFTSALEDAQPRPLAPEGRVSTFGWPPDRMQPCRRHVAALAGAALAGGALGGLPGCSLVRPSPLAMEMVYDDSACPATQAPVLLVLLPGVYMAPEEFQQQGFISAIRQRRLAVDVLIADANIGYVQDGSIRRRLQDEVIGAAHRWGYRRIWLAGISLGGFVAMAYAMQQPGEIEGIVALAPYVGRQPLVQAISDAGGPAAWRRTAVPRDAADIETQLWLWLSDPSSPEPLSNPALKAPQLWLGYGSEDRFAQGHRQLATLLSPSRVSTAPGGHDWPPWRTLWSQWLDRGVLPQRCTA